VEGLRDIARNAIINHFSQGAIFISAFVLLISGGKCVKMEGKGKQSNYLKIGLLWYIISLVVYGILLYVFEEVAILSTFYKILLLFPIALVLLKRCSWGSIGFKKPEKPINWVIPFIIGVPLIAILSRIYIYNQSINAIELTYPFFLAVLIAPITEEIFFRGFLLERFSKKLSEEIAIVIVALLFMIVHIPKLAIGVYDPVNMIFVFVLGYLYGVSYLFGGSLIYPIVFHALWNLSVSLF